MISFMTEERLAASLPWQPVHNAPQSGGPDFGVAGSRAWSSCLGFAPNASPLKAPGRIGPPVGRGTWRSVPAVGKPSGRPVAEDVNIHLRERKGEGQDGGGVLWARVILWSAGGRGLRGTWLPEGTQGTRQSSEWATCPPERLLQVKPRCCIWERSRGTSPRPRRRHLRHCYELFKHCIYLI